MRKLRKQNGFTLVEMLACIVVLLIIGAMCNSGMNFAFNSYQKSIFESDSQMLEDTMNMYIGDILRHATDVQTNGTNVTDFSNSEYRIHEGNLVLQQKSADSEEYYLAYTTNRDGEMFTFAVAGESVYAKSLYIDPASWHLEYNAVTGVFTGSYTIKSTILDDASRECTFTFRTIASY